jgi:hypothetical protein
MSALICDVENLDKAIYGGNGAKEEGLLTKMSIVSRKMDDIFKLLWFILTTLLGAVLLALLNLIQK